MSTVKPHYILTDTGELSDGLDQAQLRWPEIRDRRALLLKLVAAGAAALATEAGDRAREVGATAGALSDVYGAGELERLREDWPD
jgi:sulfite reductase beta subunit-like hemoprotein